MTTIQIPTPNLSATIKYYESLGFLYAQNNHDNLLYDAQIKIEIGTDHFSRVGIKFYGDDFSKTVQKIEPDAGITKLKNGYLTSSPSGCWVYLIEGEAPKSNHPIAQNTILGNYAGLSIEAVHFQDEVKFWESLGFTITDGGINDPWVSLINHDKFAISIMKPLMCPHLFFNPSLTFFNGKNNPKIIQKIRDKKIPIRQEITHFNEKNEVDNIILCDPSGLGFFVFND